MMRDYEEAERNRNQYIEDAARRYVIGMHQAGLQPNPRLERAIAERIGREAATRYIEDMTAILHHNLGYLTHTHQRRLNEIKRSGARLRWRLCPPFVAVFAFLAWLNFTRGHIELVMLFAVAALAWLAILVGGAIFDRPVKEEVSLMGMMELPERHNPRYHTLKLPRLEAPVHVPGTCTRCHSALCASCSQCHTPGCSAARVVCATAQDAFMGDQMIEITEGEVIVWHDEEGEGDQARRPWWKFW